MWLRTCVCLLLLHQVVSACFTGECKYNPDVDLTTPQIIRRHGYPSESHTVVTSDGYILTMHRIPYGISTNSKESQKKGVVFLQHGLLSSSADWILAGPNKSLAYQLSDNGYDVWLGNARGNTYSTAHTTLSTSDAKYWDFSWDEMAKYDIPAEIDHILQVTGEKKIYYVGHSMGTTMFFASTSENPELNNQIKVMVALAPVAYVEHMKSPVRLLAPWTNDIEFIIRYLGANSFLPQNKFLRYLSKYGCEAADIEKEICENTVFLICGFDKAQFNMSLMPVVFGHTPAGTSTKTVVHYAQEINSGKFQKYDYGKTENSKKYNSSEPPQYNISAITTPVALYFADNDWLASEQDVDHLSSQLRYQIGKFLIEFKGFNHLDFLWANDVKHLVFDRILVLLKGF